MYDCEEKKKQAEAECYAQQANVNAGSIGMSQQKATGTPNNPFSIPLSIGAIETLFCLFNDGALFDGDVPSKSGRDELVNFGLILRYEGYQTLTKNGLKMAIDAKLHLNKEREYGRSRKALNLLSVVEGLLEPTGNSASTVHNFKSDECAKTEEKKRAY